MSLHQDQIFPKVIKDGESMIITGGMSLRDLFASIAFSTYIKTAGTMPELARDSYMMADIMMKEREKRE